MIAFGLKPRVVRTHRIEDGINAVRRTLPRCVFDAKTCERGLDALRLYQAEWDDSARVLANRPRHDWTSHAADAFRYLALSWNEPEVQAAATDPPLPAGIAPDSINGRRILEARKAWKEATRKRTWDEVWMDHVRANPERFEGVDGFWNYPDE
jgi:hypothetical protein